MTVTAASAPPVQDPALIQEIERFRSSGLLGDAGRLRELFDFLVERSAQGQAPKEAEIALAVFGKSGREALKDDPVARVYVHRLRRRIDDFYLRHGTPTGARLDIPKGEYRITLASPAAESAGETVARPEAAPTRRSVGWPMAAAAVAALAVVNLVGWAVFAAKPDAAAELRKSPVWSGLAQDTRPILVVVGDYYIFGEYQDRLFLKRLIRDFAINSKEDLTQKYLNRPEMYDQYADVALGYLPTSAAFALTDLAPLLSAGDRTVEVSLASELTPDRLKTSDIIYVGLLSGMGALKDPVFQHSRFAIGESYDQIIDRQTGRSYTSEAFLAAPSDTMYRDFGYFSTFEGPTGNHIVVLAGARDTALMGVADAVTRMRSLDALQKTVGGRGDFEVLYEIKGQKHVNLESTVLAHGKIDSQAIWSGEPSRFVTFPSE